LVRAGLAAQLQQAEQTAVLLFMEWFLPQAVQLLLIQ
jgi:hypothetical protein